MKTSFFIAVLAATCGSNAQKHSLEKIWETDSTIAVPESVLPVQGTNIMYVSLIDGPGWEADGKGGIGILSPDGKTYNGNWISGLNAPKGMGIVGNRLYTADMSELVIIDIANGRIEKKIAIEGAQGLNDVAVNSKGIVYVSDSKTGKIWQVNGETYSLFMENVPGVNGLKATGDDLYIGAGKEFRKANAQKEVTKIAEVSQGIDGIEPVGKGDFILTSWAGYVYYVSANGTVETLLETHAQKKNTADIGYDPKTKTLYVPTFNGKTVVAYKVR